jgi:ABC-2 type transport system ATP-binding protein
MSADDAAIRIDQLSKTYATGKRALDCVSFDVPRGQIFGLLGPNGAGKSTLINILAGLVTKSAGKAVIWGFDIDRHPRNAKRSIGIVPQEILFDPFFTPREALEIQAGLYGIPKNARQSDALLAAMHLTDKADAYSRTLSGGMKRRLLVAKAMVHSPPILVLDEPTAGVDIELRRITFDRDLSETPQAPCFDRIDRIDERTLEIAYRKDRVNAGEVLAAVQSDGFNIVDVRTREPDLEDVFLSLTSDKAA